MTILSWQSPDPPLILGHRGASAYAPENSLAAFALALEQGAAGIELDVRLSADGWPVIIHDASCDRVAGSPIGPVGQLTVAELQQLDLGQSQTVPTLDDLFESFGRQPLYNIELKSSGPSDSGLEAAVADRIAAYDVGDRVLVSSFDPLSLRRARHHLPASVPLGFLHEGGATRLLTRTVTVQAVHPDARSVDAAYIAWAKGWNYVVNVWTVDDPPEMVRLAALGIDGLITNRPDLARATLDAWREGHHQPR